MVEILGGLLFLATVLLISGVRFVKEYDRLVVLRLGRAVGVRGPGPQIVIPLIERAQNIDTRVVTLPIPPQEAITRDNVTARVAAVCFFQIVDPVKAVVKVENALEATFQVAQTTLRTIVGQHDLDDLLSERDTINQKLSLIIDRQTESWGIKVNSVEIKDIEIPGNMQRAMARQAEAERERRAKVVAAEGEFQAAAKLRDAAAVISSQPGAMQLRQLQTMLEVASEKTSTLIIPLPMELFAGKSASDAGASVEIEEIEEA